KSSNDDFVNELERRLEYAKQNRKWRQMYMLGKFERQANIDEGIEIGIKQGIKQGIEIGREIGRENLIKNFLNAYSKRTGATTEDIAEIEELLMKS
ncbi:MAG: hypothetical protein IJS42_02420, partial [Synergistaceae bacterium]|nr:hypothetical protein [Synergistaceae bacterium]